MKLVMVLKQCIYEKFMTSVFDIIADYPCILESLGKSLTLTFFCLDMHTNSCDSRGLVNTFFVKC